MYIQSNSIVFNGWEPNQMLKDSGKINNGDILDALANTSNVDSINTNMIKTKYLPSKYLYTNVVRKDVGDRFVYGVDCVALPENANSETVSKTIFESANRAVGNFYASLAKLTVSRQASGEVNKPNLNLSQQVSAEVRKSELLKPNIFKKFTQFLSKLIGRV